MKKMKKVFEMMRTAALAIVIAIAGCNLYVINVSAGASDIVVDNKSFAEELDMTKWNVPNDDVLVEGGKIVFSSSSTGDTRLITSLPASKSSQHEYLLKADFTMTLKKLPVGEKFIIALGLASAESYYGEAGSLEITFENSNGIGTGIYAYDDNGEQTTIVEPRQCGISIGRAFSVRVYVTADMNLQVVVNNTNLVNQTSPVSLEGRIGILQTGSCEAVLSNVSIISHKYDAPENPNIQEDFESGSMNINALTSKMSTACYAYPAYTAVEEYNGSQVLRFRNAGMAYFGTLYQYSNFEVTFDIPYILHNDIIRDDGTVKEPKHAEFAFTFGGETEDYDSHGHESAAEGIVFGNNTVYSLKGNIEPIAFKGSDYYGENTNDGYSVRISVIDTIVTVEMKPLKATNYNTIVSYKIGDKTPMGYINIWSTGTANFAIDNFCVTNKDAVPNLVEVEYKSRVIEGTEDWEYEPMEVKYQDTEETGFDWPILIAISAAVGIVIILICIVITRIQSTPRRKEGKNEV